MDKTISLIIAASVLMMTALIVIAMGTGSLTDFDTSADDLKDQGCEFQQQRIEQDPSLTEDDLSENCRDDSSG